MTRPDGFPDDELDAFLATAHGALLQHLDRHTDLLPGLLAFLDAPATALPVRPHPGRTLIELRTLTRTAGDSLELSEAITRTSPDDADLAYLAFLLCLSHAFGTALDLTHGLGYRFSGSHDPVPGQARALKRSLDHALDLAQRLDLGLTRSLTRAREHVRDLVFRTDPFRSPRLRLDRDINRVLNLALDLNPVPGLGLFFNRVTHLDRVDARSLDDSLVNAVTRFLQERPADVSGTDLSDLRVTDLEVFAGAVWSRTTTWSENVAPLIEDRSYPIGPDTYRVRGGTENDPRHSILT